LRVLCDGASAWGILLNGVKISVPIQTADFSLEPFSEGFLWGKVVYRILKALGARAAKEKAGLPALIMFWRKPERQVSRKQGAIYRHECGDKCILPYFCASSSGHKKTPSAGKKARRDAGGPKGEQHL